MLEYYRSLKHTDFLRLGSAYPPLSRALLITEPWALPSSGQQTVPWSTKVFRMILRLEGSPNGSRVLSKHGSQGKGTIDPSFTLQWAERNRGDDDGKKRGVDRTVTYLLYLFSDRKALYARTSGNYFLPRDENTPGGTRFRADVS